MGRERTNGILDAGKINKTTYKFPRRAFGKILHRYRVKRGLTQEQLADLTQLSVSTISRFECGRIIPDLPTLVVLAANLEVDFNTLLGGTKPSQPKPASTSCTTRSPPSRAASFLPGKPKIRRSHKKQVAPKGATIHIAYLRYFARYFPV